MTLQNSNLLLAGDSAKAIFAEIEELPVRDIHTHVDLKLILDNKSAPDPWTALCKGDHYVSAIIESLGAMDRKTLFDPDTDPYEKWQAYASIFPLLLGNQIRDWMKMTLQELGVQKPLNPQNARAIWDELTETLQIDRWRPVDLFKNTHMVLMSTTDNPVDSLDQIERATSEFGEGYWIPAWRPDPLFNLLPGAIAAQPWIQWIEALEAITGKSIQGSLPTFLEALAERHDYFAGHGCRASDYGVGTPYGHDVSDARATKIFKRACLKQNLDENEAIDFQSYMMRFSMGLDFEKGWVSQIHFGALRNQRKIAAQYGGLDSGCDTVGGHPNVAQSLHDLLNHFDSSGPQQHKILLYSLDKTDWPRIAGLSRIFPSVYSGISWWYFDSVSGMLEFMRTMPDLGAGLAKSGPFVTDARNIYTLAPRNQVYRRCLSTVLGEAVDFRGDPLDEAKALAKYLCTDHVLELLK